MESARDRPRTRDSHRDREVPPLLCHTGPSRRHRGGRPGHQRGATGMTTDDDLDRQIQAYLESGPAELADRVLWAARAQLKTTRRRRPGPPGSAVEGQAHDPEHSAVALGPGVLVIAMAPASSGRSSRNPIPGPPPWAPAAGATRRHPRTALRLRPALVTPRRLCPPHHGRHPHLTLKGSGRQPRPGTLRSLLPSPRTSRRSPRRIRIRSHTESKRRSGASSPLTLRSSRSPLTQRRTCAL